MSLQACSLLSGIICIVQVSVLTGVESLTGGSGGLGNNLPAALPILSIMVLSGNHVGSNISGRRIVLGSTRFHLFLNVSASGKVLI